MKASCMKIRSIITKITFLVFSFTVYAIDSVKDIEMIDLKQQKPE